MGTQGEDEDVADDGEGVGEAADVGGGDVGAVGEGQLLAGRAHHRHGGGRAGAAALVAPRCHGSGREISRGGRGVVVEGNRAILRCTLLIAEETGEEVVNFV